MKPEQEQYITRKAQADAADYLFLAEHANGKDGLEPAIVGMLTILVETYVRLHDVPAAYTLFQHIADDLAARNKEAEVVSAAMMGGITKRRPG